MTRLSVPVQSSVLENLRAGDKVLVSGTLYSARDQAHSRLLKETELPFDFQGAAIYYVGPTPAKEGQIIGASGPTSSYRMDELAVPLMERGVKVMIGKGDRSESFRQAMVRHEAVYFLATGGAGALLASRIKERKLLLYEDLGPEAVYEMRVEDFPCFVAYDVHGGSIFKGGKQP